MKLNEVIRNTACWLSGAQDEEGIVVSCRIRLARNLQTAPFASKASSADQEEVIEQVLAAAQRGRQMRTATFFPMSALGSNERRLLVERHLISPALADSQGARGVLFNRDADAFRERCLVHRMKKTAPRSSRRQVHALRGGLFALLVSLRLDSIAPFSQPVKAN